jgi:hypothetical protein
MLFDASYERSEGVGSDQTLGGITGWEARKSILARAVSMKLLLLHTLPRLDTDSHIRIHHFDQDERDTSIHGDPKSTQTIQRTRQQPLHVDGKT